MEKERKALAGNYHTEHTAQAQLVQLVRCLSRESKLVQYESEIRSLQINLQCKSFTCSQREGKLYRAGDETMIQADSQASQTDRHARRESWQADIMRVVMRCEGVMHRKKIILPHNEMPNVTFCMLRVAYSEALHYIQSHTMKPIQDLGGEEECFRTHLAS